jgi:hypothetical protein
VIDSHGSLSLIFDLLLSVSSAEPTKAASVPKGKAGFVPSRQDIETKGKIGSVKRPDGGDCQPGRRPETARFT